ncbi:MAG: hypothetical protein KC456_09665, partial [Flavobacteriales bacterium]|nr:hypothetical protein [Flavobacteriales bacterium]
MIILRYLIALIAISTFSSSQIYAQCTTTIDDFPYFEGFESGSFSSHWTGAGIASGNGNQDVGWQVKSGGTNTGGTGPTGAATGTYYAYTETTQGFTGAQNTVLILKAACFDLPSNTAPYVTFNYHMRANADADMGTLALEVKTTGSWTTVWSDTGNQGSNWQAAEVDLSSYAGNTIEMRFYAVTGSSNAAYRGDRAIDNLLVSTGLDANDPACPGDANGSIEASAIFGAGTAYSYSWNTGDTTATITGLTAGTYTVTITNTGASTNKVLSTTLVDPAPPTPSGLSATSSNICENENTPVTLSIDFPSEDSIFSITTSITGDNGSNNTAGSSASWSITGIPPYASDSASLTFYYRGDMEAAAEYVTAVSENGSSIIASDPAGGQCQGAYSSKDTLVAPDSINAWALDGSVGITGVPTGMTRYCNAGGGNFYSWRAYFTISFPVSASIPYWFENSCDSVVANAVDSGYTVTVQPTSSTTYYVRYYLASCDLWSDCDSITVSVDTAPEVSVSPANPNYCGTAAALTASGASAYAWSPGTGLNQTSGSVVQASPSSSTTYTIIGVDGNGCSDTTTTTVTVTSGPSASITGTNIDCFGDSDGAAVVSTSGTTGTVTYAWSTGGTGTSITGLTAGTYTVTVSDGTTCQAIESINITQPSAALTVNIATNNTCNGSSNGSATAFAFGGTGSKSFSWSTGSTSNFIFGLSAGNYTVTVTDANGCTVSDTITITQPTTALSVSSTSTTMVSCNGGNDGAITVAGTGGTPSYTYSWSTGATTATITGLTAGNYTVTILDAASCFAGNFFTITEPATAVSVSVSSSTNITCNGGNDGAATASGTGGTGTKTYAWSSGGTSATETGLTAGTYTVTATDANGCTDTDDVTLTQPNAVSATFTTSNVSCNGGNDGSATASGTGGSGTYTGYAWTTGGTAATVTGLTAGTYTVTVTDNNGCTGTASTTITEPTVLSVTATESNVSCFGGNDGSASASASGGTSSYSYSWSTGGSGSSITGLTAGTYTVTATDANGCTETDVVILTQPTVLVASIGTPTDVSCNGGNDGAATASATGGTTSYSYAWSGGGGSSATATGLTAGTYTVTVTDANGCTDTESTTIAQPTAVSVSIGTPTDVSCNGGNDGSATASGSGGTGTITYAWSG